MTTGRPSPVRSSTSSSTPSSATGPTARCRESFVRRLTGRWPSGSIRCRRIAPRTGQRWSPTTSSRQSSTDVLRGSTSTHSSRRRPRRCGTPETGAGRSASRVWLSASTSSRALSTRRSATIPTSRSASDVRVSSSRGEARPSSSVRRPRWRNPIPPRLPSQSSSAARSSGSAGSTTAPSSISSEPGSSTMAFPLLRRS